MATESSPSPSGNSGVGSNTSSTPSSSLILSPSPSPTPSPDHNTAPTSGAAENNSTNSANTPKPQSMWQKIKEFIFNPAPQKTKKKKNKKKRKNDIDEEEDDDDEVSIKFANIFSMVEYELNQIQQNSYGDGYKMPGWLQHEFFGPHSEIGAFTDHFGKDSGLSNNLNTLMNENETLTNKEQAYLKLKAGVEDFKQEKQENVSDYLKKNNNFGLDENTANQIRKMDKYLDDYIKGLRDPSLKQGQDFLTAETALNGIKRKINNPEDRYFDPFASPKPDTYTSQYSNQPNSANYSNFNNQARPQQEVPRPQQDVPRSQQETPRPQPSNQKSNDDTKDSLSDFINKVENSQLKADLNDFLNAKSQPERNKAYNKVALSVHPDKTSGMNEKDKQAGVGIFKHITNCKKLDDRNKDPSSFNNAEKFLKDATIGLNNNKPSSPKPSPGGFSSGR